MESENKNAGRNNRQSERGKRAAATIRNLIGNDSADSGIGERSSDGDGRSRASTGSSENGGNGSEPSASGDERIAEPVQFTIRPPSGAGNENRESDSSLGSERRDDGRSGLDGVGSDRADSGNETAQHANGDDSRPYHIDETPGGIPEIKFGDVYDPAKPKAKRGRPRKGSAVVDIPGIAELLQLVYSVPPVLGLGNHWPLTDFEAKEFASAFVRAAGSIDNKRFAALLKTLEKIAPWASFAIIAYTINMPRINESLKILNDTKGKKGKILQFGTDDSGTDADAGSGEANSEPIN